MGAILRFDIHRLCAPPYIRRKFLAVVFAPCRSAAFLPRRVASQRSKAIDDDFRHWIWIFEPPCAVWCISQ